ncbi:putative LRR receptor-like serine/threonine-protein kinase EFR-like [Capsicum annuum]|nr:putative LRR receptor-like serine/threonine-protein kinase EFR-like [Capsicum annuum]
MSTLETLNLNFNSIEGRIPEVIGSLINLRELNIRGNRLIGSIHLSLSNASRLETLDISSNSLQRNIPEGIGNLHNMKLLGIQDNQLTISIPFRIFNISRIEVIAFTGNSLSGYLPNGLCNGLPIRKGLYLSTNKLHGHIFTSLSNCSQLQILSLSENEFDGPIHSEIGRLSNLQQLYLGANHLTVLCEIPKAISNLVEFEVLNIGYLRFIGLTLNPINGVLPVSTGNISTSLTDFFADSCKIKGRIPNDFGNLSNLIDFSLSKNDLVGSIPTSFENLRNLQRLNLNNDKLTGVVGDILWKLHDLALSSNNIVGTLPPEIRNLKAVTQMDMSMNQFSNGIPRQIGGLQNLVHLSLRNNKLQGSIPDSMSNMVGLEFLDLSRNNISGNIPKSLEKLQNMKYFNVSVNRLYRKGKKAPQQVDSLSAITRKRISYYELIQATDALSESNLIGSGSFGSVYKGILRSGTAIAVKVFNQQLDVAFKSFDTECEVLCSLRQRNLVKVITSCSNLDFKALVLE